MRWFSQAGFTDQKDQLDRFLQWTIVDIETSEIASSEFFNRERRIGTIFEWSASDRIFKEESSCSRLKLTISHWNYRYIRSKSISTSFELLEYKRGNKNERTFWSNRWWWMDWRFFIRRRTRILYSSSSLESLPLLPVSDEASVLIATTMEFSPLFLMIASI